MAKKAFLKDHNDIEILPITRGELVLDSSGNPAFSSNEFLATTSQPGLMSKEDKSKIDNLSSIGELTDEKVKQITTTTNASYRLLFSGTADDTTRIEYTGKSSKLLYNPSTGYLTSTKFVGDLAGTASNSSNLDGIAASEYFRYRGPIVNDTDLDTLFISGIRANEHGNGTGNSNFPSGHNYGYVICFKGDTSYYKGMQLIIDSSGTDLKVRTHWANTWKEWKTIAYTTSNITGNAATATKLKDKVSLWGNEFDGTQSLNGSITLDKNAKINLGEKGIIQYVGVNNSLYIGYGASNDWNTYICGKNVSLTNINGNSLVSIKEDNRVILGYGSAMTITDGGFVGIGNNTPIAPLTVAPKVNGTMELGTTNGIVFAIQDQYKAYGINFNVRPTGISEIQVGRTTGEAKSFALNLNPLGGAVNIASADAPTNVFGALKVGSGTLGYINMIGSGVNYLWAATTIHIGLSTVGGRSGDNATLTIKNDSIHSGFRNNAVSLGTSTYRWSEVYSVNGNFSGTITGNIDGTYVNKLTGYAKATAISALAATDTLNTALGKLEYKADVAYNLVKGAYDGDGTIENLAEILKVLEGISDTETIQAIVGKYLPLTGGTLTGQLKISQGNLLISSGHTVTGWLYPKDDGESYLGQEGRRWENTYTVLINGGIPLQSNNYNSYAPKLDGTGATGTWNINISGTAADASTLAGHANGDVTARYFNSLLLTKTNTLNNISDGVYCWVNADNPTNSVGDNSALLQLSGRKWDRFQLAFPGNNDGKIFFRNSTYESTNAWIWHDWKTIAFTSDIPTKVSQLTNDSGYLTSASLNNYVTLNTAQIITGEKTFATNILTISNHNSGDATLKFSRGSNTAWTIVDTGGNLKFNELTSNTTRLVLYENSQGGSAAFAGSISATSFIKSGSSDSYLLLGGGGQKAISDFMLKSDELTTNLTTITKSLNVTADWMDTGIKSTDLSKGTYIIQVSVSGNDSTARMWDCIWSGIMSWDPQVTNGDEPDEIILHRAGHAYANTIYIRTLMTPRDTSGVGLKLQIAANKNIGAAYTYTFKFKRVI